MNECSINQVLKCNAYEGGGNLLEEMMKVHLVGLDCAHCAAKIEDEVKKVEGIKNPQINLIKQELLAEKEAGYDSNTILEHIIKIVHQYEPDVDVLTSKEKLETSTKNKIMEELKWKILRFSLGAILFIVATVLSKDISSWIYLISYFIFGWDVLWTSLKNIMKGQVFDENFLMSISTIGAIFLNEMPEAVFVMMFYQIGETFQDYAVNRSRKSIVSLMDIHPEYANLYTEEGERKVSPEQVLTGQYILVKPGERVPLDGIVTKGESELDTSVLTGESIPRKACVGDTIHSGSVNLSGRLTMQVTKPFQESTVVKILEMVENASARKSKTERFITKFAKVYTPCVVILAVLLAVMPPLLLGGNFKMWISRALIFLVISCPCALVLSVPLGFFSGIGQASKQGILVKGSNYMDALKKVKTVVFDKTGTLTKGNFEVVDIICASEYTKEDVLRFAALGEKNSNHPIATAILDKYTKENDDFEEVESYREEGGYGISFQIKGKKYFAGNQRLMEKEGISYPEYQGIGSLVYVAEEGHFMGTIVVSDSLKEGTKEAIKKLRMLGVQKIIMLTGDHSATAEAISKELNLDGFYAELLPQQKVEKLEEFMLDTDKETLLFAGDGINDAPVLARADIGVAMGGIGSDAAIEASDMVIMNDDLGKIAEGIHIAMATHRIVNQNIIFALGVKFIVLILGALGLAQMWMAVFADVGVAFLAILNSLRNKIR